MCRWVHGNSSPLEEVLGVSLRGEGEVQSIWRKPWFKSLLTLNTFMDDDVSTFHLLNVRI